MIELPEARTIARDLRKSILNKNITDVSGNFTDHKFTFYYGNPNAYKDALCGEHFLKINDRNFYIEAQTEAHTLLLRDGAAVRYCAPGAARPPKSKLLISFDDGSCLNVTTVMYAFIAVFDTEVGLDDKYYRIECESVGGLDEAFTLPYFKGLMNAEASKMSAKAFLATGQRIPGIGNGVVQDILFNAKLQPKRKMHTLSESELNGLYEAVVQTLGRMTSEGGRNTETDIYGSKGGYQTKLCAASYKNGCPACGGEIVKEQYLGGSVYYCPACQK
jgi:formamidopyrimidine-DNA glycosylase